MPYLSLSFVRSSLIYLLLGFAFGALILAEKGISYFPPVWRLLPIHIEFLLVGWPIQLAMGVAFWIMPRFGIGAPRANETLAWISFGLVNAGLPLVALQLWIPTAPFLGRIFETAGVIIYIDGMWRRVKPHGA